MPIVYWAPTICKGSVSCVLHILFLNVTTILQIVILSIFRDKLKIKQRQEEVKWFAQGHKLARAKSLGFYPGEVPSKLLLVLQLNLAAFILCSQFDKY